MGHIAEEAKLRNEILAANDENCEVHHDATTPASSISLEMVKELQILLGQQHVELSGKLSELERLKQEATSPATLAVNEWNDSDLYHHRANEIHHLVMENETLKSWEKEFKATCRLERTRLTQVASLPDLEAIKRQHSTLTSLLSKTRVAFAPQSRVMAIHARLIDEQVSESERTQYDLRSRELFEDISERSDAYRQQVDLFNFHTQKLKLIKGQIQLLLSMRDGFLKTRESTAGLEEFKLESTLASKEFDQSLKSSNERLVASKQELKQIDAELAHLLGKQREYYALMRRKQTS